MVHCTLVRETTRGASERMERDGERTKKRRAVRFISYAVRGCGAKTKDAQTAAATCTVFPNVQQKTYGPPWLARFRRWRDDDETRRERSDAGHTVEVRKRKERRRKKSRREIELLFCVSIIPEPNHHHHSSSLGSHQVVQE